MTVRRLTTILAIDVVGYSRMMQLDSSGVLKALNNVLRNIVEPSVAAMDGRIVKLMGDGALVEFQAAFQALSCAVTIQKKMRDPNTANVNGEPIFLRMGIHAGDVLFSEKDVFGECVNIAARLEAKAEAGGVLLSKTVADLAGSDLPCQLRHEGAHSFKNISQPLETLSVDFTDERIAAKRAQLAKSQEIRFCKTRDNVSLAWTETGSGPVVIKAPNWIGHLELDWRSPALAHLFTSLAARFRLIRFDARGNGLSDWDMPETSFDLLVSDLESVFDAAGIDRAPILALSQGCAIGAAFAARCPERVSALVMHGGFALGRAKRPNDREMAKALKAMSMAGWDDDYPSLRDLMAEYISPLASLEDRRRYAEDMRDTITPENMGKFREVVDNIDVVDILSQVQAPCLVMHCTGDRMQPLIMGRSMAAGIPNARFIAYESANHCMSENDPCWPLAEREIHAFLDKHV